MVLNIGFVIVEFTYGFLTHSTALLADAGHNLSDVAGLLIAWGAALLAKRQPDNRYTYGLRSTSILAALANAMLVLIACGAIAWEALQRLHAPAEIAGVTVSIVAAIGIVVNGASAWLFMAGSKNDLNIRGAFLHMVADAAVSFGVVIAGVIIYCTAWYWLDPAISLIIVAIILISTWQLLRDAINLALNAVPSHIDLAAVRQFLGGLPGVEHIQDLHVWGMSTTETALTAHLVMPAGYPGDSFMNEIAHQLEERFSIHHCTVQVNVNNDGQGCGLHRAGG